MIPLKLQLKNFLSYGPKLQTVEFGLHPFICLSGKNGHGKSALLDAMTWALWGQARKIFGAVKPDTQLLRIGQTNLLVIFDFIFNTKTYRIRREFTLTRKGNYHAILDFGILDATTGTIRSLTEKTIRDTQQKIERMLGIDFDSFVNSAFLRQGQANEFSKKSPKDRKEILGSILQLEKYETIRKCALDKAKDSVTTINNLIQFQKHMQEKLSEEKSISQEQELVTQHVLEISKQEDALLAQTLRCKQQKEFYQKEDQEKKIFNFQVQQYMTEKNEKQQRLLTVFSAWQSVSRQCHSTLVDKNTLDQEKELLIKKNNLFYQQQQKNMHIRENYLQEREKKQIIVHALKESHAREIHTKQLEVEVFQARQENHETAYKDFVQRKKIAKHEYSLLEQELTLLATKMSQISEQTYSDAMEKQFEKRKYYYHKWVAQTTMLAAELKNIEQKNSLIDDQNPSCPLCQQNLSLSRKRFLHNTFSTSKDTINHRIARLTSVLKNLKELLIAQHKALEIYKKNKDEITILRVCHDELSKKIAKQQSVLHEYEDAIAKKAEELSTIQKNLQESKKNNEHTQALLEQKIQSDVNYLNSKAICEGLESQLQELSYNAVEHKNVADKLQELEKKEKQISEVLHELSKQEQRKNEIRELIIQLKELKKKIYDLDCMLKKYAEHDKNMQTINRQEDEFIGQLEKIRLEKEKLLECKGRLQQQHTVLKKIQEEHRENEQKIDSLTTIMQDYQAIATALSKDGIQALLIEDVLPEIEQETNALLAHLTNNQAHIIIESLRDLKKGGTKETLDIKISDSMGIRPYELFSGGEAFRIDFALRIAISKLLARRAGTSLQTLIIDEGFGSQDEEGLNHLVDALIKVQHDFAKIIIVSHLPFIKDQFPVHFSITKGPQGSTVTIIEH